MVKQDLGKDQRRYESAVLVVFEEHYNLALRRMDLETAYDAARNYVYYVQDRDAEAEEAAKLVNQR